MKYCGLDRFSSLILNWQLAPKLDSLHSMNGMNGMELHSCLEIWGFRKAGYEINENHSCYLMCRLLLSSKQSILGEVHHGDGDICAGLS